MAHQVSSDVFTANLSHRYGVSAPSFQPVHTTPRLAPFSRRPRLDDAERVHPATDDFDQRLAAGPYARPRLI